MSVDIEERSRAVIEHVREVASHVEPRTIGLHEPFFFDLGNGEKVLVIATDVNMTRSLGGTEVSIGAVDYARFVREHTLPA